VTNKYLEKIAKAAKSNAYTDSRTTDVVAGGAAALAGAGLASEQYHRGNLTGRETLYHGTSRDRADSIRKNGLTPNHSHSSISGVVDPNLANMNKDLVFTTKSKFQGHMYAAQQRGIDNGRIKNVQDHARGAEHTAKDAFKSMATGNDKGVVKLNVPTWKEGHKGVWNPEVRSQLRSMKSDLLFKIMNPTKVQQDAAKKIMYNTLQKSVHVHRGAEGIGTQFIRGSGNYQKNSLKEVGQFISGNRGRFAKGVGAAAAGVALAGLGAKLMAGKKKD